MRVGTASAGRRRKRRAAASSAACCRRRCRRDRMPGSHADLLLVSQPLLELHYLLLRLRIPRPQCIHPGEPARGRALA